jgi:hypothetical protein
MSMNINIEVVQTAAARARTGYWKMQWGDRRWEGLWTSDADEVIVVRGDAVRETPISEDALRELIYCTQDTP